jgi:hypothetical protein
MSKHDIIIPGGNALSVIFDRLQQELCPAYGAETARRVLQAILETIGQQLHQPHPVLAAVTGEAPKTRRAASPQ